MELIVDAVARTQAVVGARIRLQLGERPLSQVGRSIRARLNPMRGLAMWVVRIGSTPRADEGVLDLRSRRYMLFGDYAQVLYADGTIWAGAPGETLPRRPTHRNTTPVALWLWGLTGARERGQENVRAAPCRRFALDLDASRLPSLWNADPDASRATVWIGEDGYVHRIKVNAHERSLLIELWDFGSHLVDLDLSRLPTRRSSDGI